jgi:hypothetical protein
MVATRQVAFGWVLASFLVLVGVALLPFIAWAAFVSTTYSLGERSREIGSLLVLMLASRGALIGIGALGVLVLGAEHFGVIALRQRMSVAVILGVLAAGAMLLWSRAIAPSAKPQLLPNLAEAIVWIAMGALAALPTLYAYSKLRGSS